MRKDILACLAYGGSPVEKEVTPIEDRSEDLHGREHSIRTGAFAMLGRMFVGVAGICDAGAVIDATASTRWYAAGLRFECAACGGCCAGPGEGYIWVVRPEIELIARHLNMTQNEVQRRFLRRVGPRTSIVEHGVTKDCIFLRDVGGTKQCAIYPVRPSQCRSWPFWPENLLGPEAWGRAAMRCPGIDRGRHYSCQEIERIRENKPWWENRKDTAGSSKK